MRVLVVSAHPVPTSFVAAVRATLIAALRRHGHEVRDLDLYAIGWDPVISRAERERYMERGANADGLEEQLGHIRWAEALIFVYPTWWYSLPAMLKGWIDRVWVPYETFELEGGIKPIRGLMGNIRLLGGISTYGSPRWWIRYVVRDPGRKVIMQGLRPLCHRRCRSFWLGHYRMDDSTPETRADFLTQVARLGARLPA